MIEMDVLVIGGGLAGMAAALGAKEGGCKNISLLESEAKLGGMLRSYYDPAFGQMPGGVSGSEAVQHSLRKIQSSRILVRCNSTVCSIDNGHFVTAVSSKYGLQQYHAKAIVLATGCFERPLDARITGTRPAGIFSAGMVQQLFDAHCLPGSSVIIYGSGGTGLAMARRMTQAGIQVQSVFEPLPYARALLYQKSSLNESIPILLNHTITCLHGVRKLEGVSVAQIDAQGTMDTQKRIDCDTLVYSLGLVPDKMLGVSAKVHYDPCTGGPFIDECYRTSVQSIFACGNALFVYNAIDDLVTQARLAGLFSAEQIKCGQLPADQKRIIVSAGVGVRGVLPQFINKDTEKDVMVTFWPNHIYSNARVCVEADGEPICVKSYRLLTPGESVMVTLPFESYIGTDRLNVFIDE